VRVLARWPIGATALCKEFAGSHVVCVPCIPYYSSGCSYDGDLLKLEVVLRSHKVAEVGWMLEARLGASQDPII
jgi:hypothetical protein